MIKPEILEMLERVGATKKQNLGVYQFYEHELQEFINQYTKYVIDEFVETLFLHGIDESNNPQFYKAVEKMTK